MCSFIYDTVRQRSITKLPKQKLILNVDDYPVCIANVTSQRYLKVLARTCDLFGNRSLSQCCPATKIKQQDESVCGYIKVV